MGKQIISTNKAPQAIGTYSQAVRVNDTIYLSGQVALIPETMAMVEGGIDAQLHQVFKNVREVVRAAGGELSNIVKLNIYLTDLSVFTTVNEIMAVYFSEPYPARAAVEVSALPKNALVEIDGVMVV